MAELRPLCRVCYGIHQHVPCPGRPQTDREWLEDRGIPRDRIDVILAARSRLYRETKHELPDLARPPHDQRRLF